MRPIPYSLQQPSPGSRLSAPILILPRSSSAANAAERIWSESEADSGRTDVSVDRGADLVRAANGYGA